MVEVKNLQKRFSLPQARPRTLRERMGTLLARRTARETLDALTDVTLAVRRGEFLGIIGRNGSGKSTLLKILARILRPTTGTVTVRGTVSAFLELGTGFHPELSARENVFLNGVVLGLSRSEIRERYPHIVAFSSLEKFMDAKLKTFSSGMQIRLAFAVAIYIPADIYLLDEIFAVGDLEFQIRCRHALQNLRREGKTILLVSHDLAAVRSFCNRAILLEDGAIASEGAPERVVSDYVRLEHGRAEAAGVRGDTRRFGDQTARIEQVHILDAEGRDTTTVHAHEHTTIVLETFFTKTCAEPVFGITIRDRDLLNVFVTNTRWLGMRTGTFRAGERARIAWTISADLSRGRYWVSPAIAHADLQNFHDWRDNVAEFSVKSPYDSGGIVELAHRVTIERATAPADTAVSSARVRDTSFLHGGSHVHR